MRSKLFKIIFKTIVMIAIFFTVSLTACNCGGDTESSDTGGSSDDGSIGFFDDGSSSVSESISGNVDGESVDTSENSIISNISITETDASMNYTYDENDYGISFSIYTDGYQNGEDGISLSIKIYQYTAYQEDTIYEFSDPYYLYAKLTIRQNGSNKTYDAESVQVSFTSVPTSKGDTVAGKIKFIISDSDSIEAEFEAELGASMIIS